MTRRITIHWPDPRPFVGAAGGRIRILAASDEEDRALQVSANRETIGAVDLLVGCGDLSPDQLAFLADAFRAPLVYVRGNHDRDPWPDRLPSASSGRDNHALHGIPLLALPWPMPGSKRRHRDESAAWVQVISSVGPRLLVPARRPWLVFSHVPPRGAGDTPTDAYHLGFAAYRFVLDRLRPPLWLHGHTNLAATPPWQTRVGPTTLINVTGSVLIDLVPAAAEAPAIAIP